MYLHALVLALEGGWNCGIWIACLGGEKWVSDEQTGGCDVWSRSMLRGKLVLSGITMH